LFKFTSHSCLEKWKGHAVQAVAHLDKVVGISNMKYLNGLCKQFASQLTANRHPHKVLDKVITKLGKIELTLKCCNAIVLQEAGIGPEYTVIHTELTQVCHLWQHIEALLCEAMLNSNDLVAAHSNRELSYQTV
jgi:hypothetical protein